MIASVADEGRHVVKLGARRAWSLLERFPIRWNHVIGKESLNIKLEQVLVEKVRQLL
jgi:hypothetical protein